MPISLVPLQRLPAGLVVLCAAGVLTALAGCAAPASPGAADPASAAAVNATGTQPVSSRPERDLEMSQPGDWRLFSRRPKAPDLPEQPAFDTTQLLAYADRLRAMGPAETTAEIARLSDHPDDRHATFSMLQLAIALTQTRNPQDTARAQTLLLKVLANGEDEARGLHPLARLLASRVADQRRLEDQIDRQAQQLRDSQRKIDQLNERLEAVRAIERSLTRNGNPLATPAVPASPKGASGARP